MSKPRPNKRRHLLRKWGLIVGGCTAGIIGALLALRGGGTAPVPAALANVEGLTSVLRREMLASPIRFEERAHDAGLNFVHFPGVRSSRLPEDMGSGVAVGDYDGDGFEDVYLVNFAHALDGPSPDAPIGAGHSRLYRNNRDGTFADVTESSGAGLSSFGMGAAWGDYDNDGDLDLYVTNYGPNVLLRNDGGRFIDVTRDAGVGDDGFSAGCAWADYDRDGDLDLYVCSYVEFEMNTAADARMSRQNDTETPYTLNPSSYPPVPNRLYRNNGDGTFSDVAGTLGVADEDGRSLGVMWIDLDLDGWVDLYVANDVSSNAAFYNNRDGTFSNVGPQYGIADYRGAMGLAADDFQRDGDLDLLVTHWVAQENAFYVNMRNQPGRPAADSSDGTVPPTLFYFDSADRYGLGQSSLDMVGWATGFIDFDNDGWSDLWVVNGSTLEMPRDNRRLRPQPMLLYSQRPDTGFFPVADETCPKLREPCVGRGGAQFDIDHDGRWDLLVSRFGDTPLLFHNVSASTNNWLDMRLRQTGGNTQAIGAIVRVTAGGWTRAAQVGAGPSYLSQHSDTLHFGLGDASMVETVEIRWPDGVIETHEQVEANQRVEWVHEAHYGSRALPTESSSRRQ